MGPLSSSALFTLPALRRARDLIDRDYASPLDLDALAHEAGYSRYHFAHAFAAAYGEAPRAYLCPSAFGCLPMAQVGSGTRE
jgi:AraC-like DNA-binding protein